MKLERFREFMESIRDPWHRYTLTYIYETASRSNEAAGVGLPGDKHTVAVVPTLENVSYDSYEGTEILVISFATLKRQGRPDRFIGLPLKSVDPWVDFLARTFSKLGPKDPLVPYDRDRINRLFKRYGFAEKNSEKSLGVRKNPLRHDRINHLISYYHFEPLEVTLFAGWSMASTSMAFGGAPTITEYAHQMWHLYIQKLLKPLPKVP